MAAPSGDGFVVSLADLKNVKLRKTSSSSDSVSTKTARRKSFHFGQRYLLAEHSLKHETHV